MTTDNQPAASKLTAFDCIEYRPDNPECKGTVEYRMSLSPSGRSYPRCWHHWSARLDTQASINRRYPSQQPADFDPTYAGERWSDEN